MQLPPFNEYLGTKVELREAGEARVVLDLKPHHLNMRGVAHGGVISALLDTALGGAVIASIPKEWWCATIQLSINYLDGPRGGHLIAEGRVTRRGARVAFAAGEVKDESGRLLATAEGSWHLWTRKPGSSPAPRKPYVQVEGTGETVEVGKILAIGRNYADHVAEMNAPKAGPPVLFLKPATAVIHHGDSIVLPAGAGEVHHEVELVAVIGEGGKAIREEDALNHVLGYAVGLDMTLRDIQAKAKEKGTPWSLAKGFDSSAPVSRVMPKDQVGDGSGLAIRLTINGEQRQSSRTDLMMRSVAELIAFASKTVTLERGDLLFTGTPAGVGPVNPGDSLTAEIEKIGALTVSVRAEE